MRSVFVAVFLLTAATAVAGEAPPAGRLPQSVVPEHYSIELTIDPTAETFTGRVVIDVVFKSPQDAFWIHGQHLEVKEVFLEDAESNRVDATWAERLDSGVVRVTLARTVPAGPARLHVAYNARFNDAGYALYRAQRGELWYAATQFQPIGARQVFPGFDEPGFKVPFDLAVVTRKGDVAVTTTPEISVKELSGGMVRHEFARTRPLPTYLLAFAVGPYDVVDYGKLPPSAVRGRELPLRGIAVRGQGAKMRYALHNTRGLLEALEQYFGTGYPYRKLDLIAAPGNFGGAMENVGAITYDEYLLLMDDDSPLNQRRSYTHVHAHELAHQWFGNLVTPKWWDDLWLNESFATWMAYKAAATHWPEGEFTHETLKGALSAMASDALVSARRIREPIDDSNDIASAFDAITYQKGSGVLAMLERFVGPEQFRAGVRLHMSRHADGTATAGDFIASVAAAADEPRIEAAFRSFIDQAGVPLLQVTLQCAGTGNVLRVRQSRYAPLGSAIRQGSRWTIPFCAANGHGGTRSDSCTLVDKPEETVPIGKGACPDWVHPNAGGAGYYRFALDDAAWRRLITNAGILGTAEALVLVDSLDAAFRADRIPADLYVSGMAALAGHEAWDVVEAATDRLEGITDIFEDRQLPAVHKALVAIAGPRLAKPGDAEDAASVLLRQQLRRFLVVVAKDPALSRTLAGQAAAAIGFNRKADPAALPATEMETAFTAGVRELGEPFFDLLFEKALASDDPAFRRAALGALARVEDPANSRKLQAAILARKMEGAEATRMISRQVYWRRSSDDTWAWLKANAEAIIDIIPETFRSSTVPGFGATLCSADGAEGWQEFITAHGERLPGHERVLAQAMERIHLCAALRKERAEELLAAFGKHQL